MNRKQRRAQEKHGPAPIAPGAAASIPKMLTEAFQHHQAGRLSEAAQLYQQILGLDPRHADSLHLLGNVAYSVGRHDLAVDLINQAIAVNAKVAMYHCTLGNAQKELGRLDDAISCWRRALALKPDYPEAHSNLGLVLREQGRIDEAVAHCRKAIALRADFPEAHNNLGSAVQAQGRLDDAAAAFRQAIALRPDYTEAHSNLGIVQQDLGRPDEARASHLRAQETRPGSLRYSCNAQLFMPIIADSTEAIAVSRKRYEAGIGALTDSPPFLDVSIKDVNPRSFYLAYHNVDNRPVMEALHRLFRAKVGGLTFTAPHLAGWQSPAVRGRRVRVGFLSEFLVGHTVGNLNQGFIEHLDRDRFDVVLIHTAHAKRDALSNILDRLADTSLTLPHSLEAQQQAVAAAELDVLIYPDIGMAPSTYFLAYARLAPVQAVMWGHPDTTGLDSIDYFVSSKSIEPDNAQDVYTERLIRLDRLNCYYTPPQAPTDILSRAELGLPETGILYGCPQSLFKFHPDFDAVLAAIALGDPTGRIVLIAGDNASWAEQIRARWQKTDPILLERTLFLPRMPRDRFVMMLAHIDILLDPIHFGSGNTLYEAMVGGTPVITWPGQFMRGRIVAGAYRQMGIADAPIAPRIEDYAPLALALGRDPDRREALRQSLRSAAGRDLFMDMSAVRGIEAFLDAAVAAAGRGERLPTDWHPDLQAGQSPEGGSRETGGPHAG
ncbi:tetratricopeptide repeat protein [Magnetospirillum fulvum]|uniref:protein O-GlcNAc transferase n=1 Tax=Magnetospirillum fulvum TaxID=1082 RepID=A0A1H6HF98_MAGFU|nr:glycosyltransferase family 41 protein [Magnetospirillum fulvum]SEH33792.1 Predicted O-linked N-acetylglucosamine transferase, SPINDLY family [Magnetospirillum fulvum]